jgi:hypothetical protein
MFGLLGMLCALVSRHGGGLVRLGRRGVAALVFAYPACLVRNRNAFRARLAWLCLGRLNPALGGFRTLLGDRGRFLRLRLGVAGTGLGFA